MIALPGILILGIVYQFAGHALRQQLDQRTLAVATNLSDATAGFVRGKNVLELNALITKYARLDGVAYVFIADLAGNVLGSSVGTLPAELRPHASQDMRQTVERSLRFRGRPVQETRVPILEGQAGAAYVGIWRDAAEAEIRNLLLPMVGLIALAIVAGIIASLLLARRITRPILGLAVVADKISKGDLDVPIEMDSNDEMDELARSLERMRNSLKVAMARVGQASTVKS
jgi:methyl-accepting chemotaxis protein